MMRKLVAPLFMMALGSVTVMLGHHGTAGVYDYGHRITTKATVTQYQFANPHVQIYFTLRNDNGEVQTWGVETASPGNMLANGWSRNTFKKGDELLVSFVPAKGDRTFGTCAQFVFVKDGKRLGGNGRCGGGGESNVDSNTLPIKPGYTAVAIEMPKDTRTRQESLQEQ